MMNNPQSKAMGVRKKAGSTQSSLWRELKTMGASADAAAGEPNASTDTDTGNFNPERTEYVKRPDTIFVSVCSTVATANKTGETGDHDIVMAMLKNLQDLIKLARISLSCIIILAMFVARTSF